MQGGLNHPAIFLPLSQIGEWPDQELKNILGDAITDEEGDDETDETIKQALAQLDQMVEQRHLVALLIVGHDAAFGAAATPTSAAGSLIGSWAGS